MSPLYPTLDPPVDLRPYLEPDWYMGSAAWRFQGWLLGNLAEIHLRTRNGQQRFMGYLPEEFWPAGQEIFEATAAPHGGILVVLDPDGRVIIAREYGHVVGDITNLVLRGRYLRRAA